MNAPGRQAVAGVPSPCVNICRMDAASGLCEGCRRTLDEIANWSLLPDAAKRAVWAQLPGRSLGLPAPAAGRTAPPPGPPAP